MRRRAALAGIALLAAGTTHVGGVAKRPRATGRRPFAFQRLAADGVTGAGVTVGVLDPSGFDPRHPTIVDAVGEHRSFGRSRRPVGRSHGVAVADVLTTVAPDATLRLAGYADSGTYRAALRWLSGDVDVAVVPAAFYGTPDDGTAPVSRATADVGRSAVVVAAAGNLARRTWRGRVEEGRLAGPAPRLRLAARERVALWGSLRGTDRPASAFTLALAADGGPILERARPYRRDEPSNLRLGTVAGPGRFRVRVEGPPDATASVEVTALHHPLVGADPAGSLAAPATARRVLGVGAGDEDGPAPYSGRGPTVDGRRGVDLLAPARTWAAARPRAFRGSSAATAYVGGVAALAAGSAPEAGPALVRRALLETAVDVGTPGSDPATGAGLLAPEAAVDWLRAQAGARWSS